MAAAASESPIGLGAWAFGRTGWGVQHDRDSRAAILRAIEHGVNWIDTAPVYGDGHSERLVGKTLAELAEGDRPMVFTKCGLRVDRRSAGTVRDLRPGTLRRECEASLKRLGVERIDLLQLHWPVDDAEVVQGAWATLCELRDEGTIDRAGVSNFSRPLLERCAAAGRVDTAQFPLSMLSRDAGRDLIPWASAHGVRGLGYSPLESGLLSGGFSLERLRGLPDSDWRSRREQFKRPRIDRTLDLVARLRPIASALDASVAELAIAWTLAWPGVAGVVVGARNAEQVDGWARAATLDLDVAVLEQIDTAISESGAGDGPARLRTV